MKEGKGWEAKEYFQRCVDVTPDMAQHVIRAARDRNVDCIVAPYEADAQLAHLALSGIADLVVTEDSDLTLFGCERVLFKLTDSGDCVLYEKEHLNRVFGLQADLFNFDKFRYMCITAGCDYLASLPGIGLGKAKNFWLKVSNPDLRNELRNIPAYLRMPQVAVTEEYIERFIRANNTFLYQLVFDPVTRTEKPLTAYPANFSADEIGSMKYCGSYSPPEIATQMALGNVNIRSKERVGDFNPDRAAHTSMWSKESLEMGPAMSGHSQKPGFAFKISNSEAKKMTSHTWLAELITTHYLGESPMGLSVPEFMKLLLIQLSSNDSAEELESQLIDLCGYDHFEMIAALLENRQNLVRADMGATLSKTQELEKKLMDQGEPAALKQQEDMSIKGKSARQMVMQRLMGSRDKVESVVLLLRNMVTHEEVDESLQEEIEEECNKYGKVTVNLINLLIPL